MGAGQASRLSLRGLGAAILWIKALTEGMHSVTGNSKPRAPFQDFTRAIHDLMAVPHSELKKLYRWYLSDSINDPHHHPFAKYAKRMGHPATQTPNTKPELSVVKYGTAEVTTFHNPISLAARL